MKKKNKKILSLTVIILALVLVGGFAYAAISGTLFFTGTATLASGSIGSDTIQLQFHSVSEHVENPHGSVATVKLAPRDGIPNQEMVIDINFTPTSGYATLDDEINIEFSIENTGTKPVRVTKFNKKIMPPDEEQFVLDVQLMFFPSMPFVIQPGEIVSHKSGGPNMYMMVRVIGLGSEKIPTEDLRFGFTASLDYEEEHTLR